MEDCQTKITIALSENSNDTTKPCYLAVLSNLGSDQEPCSVCSLGLFMLARDS